GWRNPTPIPIGPSPPVAPAAEAPPPAGRARRGPRQAPAGGWAATQRSAGRRTSARSVLERRRPAPVVLQDFAPARSAAVPGAAPVRWWFDRSLAARPRSS